LYACTARRIVGRLNGLGDLAHNLVQACSRSNSNVAPEIGRAVLWRVDILKGLTRL
jgi:hypothetical protein